MARSKTVNGFVFNPQVTGRSWDLKKRDYKLITSIMRFTISQGFVDPLLSEETKAFNKGRIFGAAELLNHKYPFITGSIINPDTGYEYKGFEIWYGVLEMEAERFYYHVLSGGFPAVTGCYSYKRALLDESIEQTLNMFSRSINTMEILENWLAA